MPVDEEQKILARMLELHRAGNGAVKISRALNAEGLTNPRTGRPWYDQAVHGILSTAEKRERA